MSDFKPSRQVSGCSSALIVFVDVIDSSKYSSVLGMDNYAKQLLRFQDLFEKLGNLYFPSLPDKANSYAFVRARGDEGIIFYVSPNMNQSDLIHNAVKFSFELKAKMGLEERENGSNDRVPMPMKIGVGIHYDVVSNIVRIEAGTSRSIIERIEGFSINYAKRIESCSRLGKFSHIFLSKKAAFLLDDSPIIFKKYTAPLKGIDVSEEVFEVLSAFFENIPHDKDNDDLEDFYRQYYEDANKLDTVSHPWLKSFAISVIDTLYRNARTVSLKEMYFKKLIEIIWKKPVDDDPIILFCRSKHCDSEGKQTQSLSYLRQLVEDHPYFVHARKKLVQACWNVAKKASESSERVFARDVADEFLNRFPEYLSEEDKGIFKKILHDTKANKKTKNAKRPT